MRIGWAVLILSALTNAGAAALDGKAIEALLNDTTAYGLPLAADSWRQQFSRNGETIYIDASGAKTIGEWMVRGDTYCSQWPPSDRWTCYGIETGTTPDGKPSVTWISGGGGKRFDALLVAGKHVDEAAPPAQ
jgi:hypothetical protein